MAPKTKSSKKSAPTVKRKSVIGSTAKKPKIEAKVAKKVGAGTDPKRVIAILQKLD